MLTFFTLLFFSLPIFYICSRKNFFLLKSEKVSSHLSCFIVGFLFIFFFSLQLVIFPLFFAWFQEIGLFKDRMWFQTFHILVTFMAIVLFTLLLSAKNRQLILGSVTKNSIEMFFWGALLALLAYPVIINISFILEQLGVYFYGETEKDQVAVKLLKQSLINKPLFISLAISMVVLVPVTEELLFRGFLQRVLVQSLGNFNAFLITSLVFTVFHYASSQGVANLEILPPLFLLSLLLCFLREKTETLVTPIALHATFNALSILFLFFSESLVHN